MVEQQKKKPPTFVIVLRVALVIVVGIMLFRAFDLQDWSLFPLAIFLYIVYLFALKY